MSKVLIKKLDPSVKLPSYKSEGASGMDLTAFLKKSITLKPKTSSLIPTGISIAFSKDYEIQIRPRSGLAAKQKVTVLNSPGTIDSDFRGEIKVILINLGKNDFEIRNGDRIAQMVLCPVSKAKLYEIDDLSETDRGSGGFGSTGKN